MEFIKKTVLRIMTTGTTAPCSHRDPETGALITGCTAMTLTMIPATGVTYNFGILLNQEVKNLGFYDAYLVNTPYDYINIAASNPNGLKKFEKFLSGGTTLAASGLVISHDSGFISGTTITYTPYVVTGECTSRLIELRKYTVTNVFSQQYFTGGTYVNDGVDVNVSIPNVRVVYYLGGIKYVDLLTGSTSGSTFRFTSQGYTNPNFINLPVYKNPNKENIISNPEITNDVFIVRQELSAFDGNYRLEYIKNLVDLETYAAGNFFNIVKNT